MLDYQAFHAVRKHQRLDWETLCDVPASPRTNVTGNVDERPVRSRWATLQLVVYAAVAIVGAVQFVTVLRGTSPVRPTYIVYEVALMVVYAVVARSILYRYMARLQVVDGQVTLRGVFGRRSWAVTDLSEIRACHVVTSSGDPRIFYYLAGTQGTRVLTLKGSRWRSSAVVRVAEATGLPLRRIDKPCTVKEQVDVIHGRA
jgi:hypothetical protein